MVQVSRSQDKAQYPWSDNFFRIFPLFWSFRHGGVYIEESVPPHVNLSGKGERSVPRKLGRLIPLCRFLYTSLSNAFQKIHDSSVLVAFHASLHRHALQPELASSHSVIGELHSLNSV